MQSQICRLHIYIYKCWFIYIIIVEFNHGIQRWKIHNVSPLPSYDCSKANHGQMEALKYWLNDPQVLWLSQVGLENWAVGSEKKTTIGNVTYCIINSLLCK